MQNLITTTVNMVDTFMIGSLGEDYVSAVGLASKIFFILNILVFGIASGCSVLLSQYYGKGDEDNLNKTLGFMLLLTMISSLLFFVAAVSMPTFLMQMFTKSKVLIEIGASYLRIVSFSYIFSSVSLAVTCLCRSINKTNGPMIFTFASVLVNVLCNYIFIFGNWGSPMLYADGAAIGTIIARGMEFTLCVLYLLVAKKNVNIRLNKMLSFGKETIKKSLIVGLPVIINELGWALGTTMYSVVYGHMSNDVVAAMTIATALEELVYAFLFGVSASCAVIVGNQLGANDLDGAKKTARKLLLVGLGISVILAGILFALIKPYIMLYETTEEVANIVTRVCIAYAILMPARTFNLIMIVGILRSGGDTLFCMTMELITLWGIGLVLGTLGAFVWKLDVVFVFVLFESEQIVKNIVGYYRYRQKKWVKNIVIKEY